MHTMLTAFLIGIDVGIVIAIYGLIMVLEAGKNQKN